MLRRMKRPNKLFIWVIVIVLMAPHLTWTAWADTTGGGEGEKNGSPQSPSQYQQIANGVVHVLKGVPAPFTGILLPVPDAAELLERAKTAEAAVRIWKRWAIDYSHLVQETEREICQERVGYWKDAYKSLAEQKTSGVPWWTLVVIGIGAIGIGVGVGVGLSR